MLEKRVFGAKLINFLGRPDYVFVVLALFFGTFFCFVMPLFKVPDEPAHFYRAYQVGEGKITSETSGARTGGYVRQIPSGSDLFSADNTGEVFVDFPGPAVYSPAPYIAQAIGIDLGRLIHPSVSTMAHMGRIMNLLLYIALIVTAIRIAVVGKWVYAFIALFPVAIQQASSLSTDVLNIGIPFIIIALVTKLVVSKDEITKKEFIALTVAYAVLALTKQTNLILLMLLLLIPNRVFGGKKSKTIRVTIIFLASIAVTIAWFLIIKSANYMTDQSTIPGVSAGVNSVQQIMYVVSHPVEFLSAIIRSFLYSKTYGSVTSDFYLESMFGVMSNISYKMPLVFTFISYTTLLLLLITNDNINRKKRIVVLKKSTSVLFLVTFFLGIVSVASALYVVWSDVGSRYIAGIQGRYFLSFIPLLIPIFFYMKRYIGVNWKKEHYIGVMVFGVSAVNLIMCLYITHKWFLV